MALTPEDIVNKRFTITKFRDGYDLDQVDDFLDEVGRELRRLQDEASALKQENEELRDRVQGFEAGQFAEPRSAVAAPSEPAQDEDSEETVITTPPAQEPVVVPAPAVTVVEAESTNEASKSSGMLQLALELHDKHVRDGEEKRDALIREGESTARELVSDAQKQRADELARLNTERAQLQTKIKDLREFEGEYRSTLRSYIQGQLRGLDGSPEPEGAPSGLE
ncbi:DivIVA domain-containing protein [Lysinibacter sp. HNR]|uniref:DivIVA domain-containing protein n=1 Tax=Lysinibacter sp. HNR TaxID=3031408 RepID=UPI0024348265|nr:DivIVA domain-containing protein [Lysinibacter sp. HNR]WGD36462.1 DivIVA domain-containing protein [Lysinibacter sp. HNR]